MPDLKITQMRIKNAKSYLLIETYQVLCMIIPDKSSREKMMRSKFLAIMCIIWIAISYEPICLAEVDGKTDNDTNIDLPQEFVVCTGWHALCTASYGCIKHDDKADCDCMKVNETHIVATSEIQDTKIKNLTRAKCTNEHPCDVDQAPVCSAIKDGQYEVDGVKYDWVSTYSYRGWCGLLMRNLTACDQNTIDYTGDRYWANASPSPIPSAPWAYKTARVGIVFSLRTTLVNKATIICQSNPISFPSGDIKRPIPARKLDSSSPPG